MASTSESSWKWEAAFFFVNDFVEGLRGITCHMGVLLCRCGKVETLRVSSNTESRLNHINFKNSN